MEIPVVKPLSSASVERIMEEEVPIIAKTVMFRYIVLRLVEIYGDSTEDKHCRQQSVPMKH